MEKMVEWVASRFVDCVWNVMTRAQKLDFVFRRNGRVHLDRQGRQFSRLLAAQVCVSALVMLDAPCSEVVWRVMATHSIRQFPLHFPSRGSPCAITFQLDSTFFKYYYDDKSRRMRKAVLQHKCDSFKCIHFLWLERLKGRSPLMDVGAAWRVIQVKIQTRRWTDVDRDMVGCCARFITAMGLRFPQKLKHFYV
jgi:hypothetical protein